APKPQQMRPGAAQRVAADVAWSSTRPRGVARRATGWFTRRWSDAGSITEACDHDLPIRLRARAAGADAFALAAPRRSRRQRRADARARLRGCARRRDRLAHSRGGAAGDARRVAVAVALTGRA